MFRLPEQQHTLDANLLIQICFQEEQNKGKPNWEHLEDDLHVLVTVDDTQNRAAMKMERAVSQIKKLLVPTVSNDPPPLLHGFKDIKALFIDREVFTPHHEGLHPSIF